MIELLHPPRYISIVAKVHIFIQLLFVSSPGLIPQNFRVTLKNKKLKPVNSLNPLVLVFLIRSVRDPAGPTTVLHLGHQFRISSVACGSYCRHGSKSGIERNYMEKYLITSSIVLRSFVIASIAISLSFFCRASVITLCSCPMKERTSFL